MKLDVVTHQKWLVDEFKSLKEYDVVQNFGFDAPRPDTLLWCPGDYAARLYASGYELDLVSAGPKWLAELDWPWIKRRVWAGTALDLWHNWDRLQTFKGSVHCKMAEAKNDKIPAKIYSSWKEFCDLLNAEKIPLESYIQISDPVDYVAEVRFFTTRAATRYFSVYRIDDYFWDHPDFLNEGLRKSNHIGLFAFQAFDFLKDLLKNVEIPPGVVIDIGKDSKGNFSVVEANAAWSSTLYSNQAQSVIKPLRLSNQAGKSKANKKWLWKPDASQLVNVRKFNNNV